jgi:hypothetical protein
MKVTFVQQRIVHPVAQTLFNGQVITQFGVAYQKKPVLPNVMRERKLTPENAIVDRLEPVGKTEMA